MSTRLSPIHLGAAMACILGLSTAAQAQVQVVPGQQLRQRDLGTSPAVRPEAVQADLSRFRPHHWDFEDGTLQGFVHEGTGRAFHPQPTFGENVSVGRALSTGGMTLPPNPCAGLVLDAATTCETGAGATFSYLTQLRHDLNRLRTDLEAVGGSYAATPFPIGKQGHYWIGTHENRPSRRIDGSRLPGRVAPRPQPWGTVQGDRETGRLISPEFEVQHNYFHFLVGGGCSNRVGVSLHVKGSRIDASQLQQNRLPAGVRLDSVQLQGVTGAGGTSGGSTSSGASTRPLVTQEWQTARDASGKPIEARGHCVENMVRVSFDIRNLKGVTARILIADDDTGAWGHINVDDLWITNDPPKPSSRQTDPVFGVADLHAHLVNELGFKAFGPDGRTPEAWALWGSSFGPLENMSRCNDTHTATQDEVTGSTYTLCRDLCMNLLEGAGLHSEFHDTDGGYPHFRAWPMWYSAIHQQMHWSWVRRAYQGGLRLLVATVGNSEIIAFSLAKEKDRQFTSDQDALALQIPAIRRFAQENSDWVEVAETPQQARRIMNSGKLALIIGVELDHVMDNCNADVTSIRHHRARDYAQPAIWASQTGYNLDVAGTLVGIANFLGAESRVMHVNEHPRTCTPAQIEARLDALYRQGVRHVIPMHFSNNMLGGYAINGSLFVASAVFGDPDARPPTLGTAEEARGIDFKLGEVNIPIWARLRPEALLDASVMPPGIGRTIMQFFTGQCIEDDGWRIALGFLTAGATEVGCAVSSLTMEMLNGARNTMPYEGATDSPAMIPLGMTRQQHELPGHVNERGLSNDGRIFVREMMRRGMWIDVQHASEKAKKDIFGETATYPVMASHGGVQTGSSRANENVLSRDHLRKVYAPEGGFVGGVVGLGTQSSQGFVQQLRAVATGDGVARMSDAERELRVQSRGVALGTDINGLDWHAGPRFGRYGYYHETPDERRTRVNFGRDGGVGPMVRYEAYDARTQPHASVRPDCNGCGAWPMRPADHPPLKPLQVTRGREVTRTFDINYDGLAHFGLVPDFLQEVRVLGATGEEMGMLYRSAEATLRMWEESCYLAYQRPSPPASLVRGCGPRSLYP